MKKPQVIAVGFLGNPAEVSKALTAIVRSKQPKGKPEAENKPLARGEVANLIR